jgi:anti-sigma factor RsiW
MNDDELKRFLDERAPRHAAPGALKERLAAQLASPHSARPRASRWLVPSLSALAAAALVLLLVRAGKPGFAQRDTFFDEAINDHLRVVASQHPVEIESGGIHQVKPWFTGRLDFAPPVSFSGDADFPLRGGSVGYFGERRAAVFVFARRLHTISLFVFPDQGSAAPAHATHAERGFNVLAWRANDFAYVLVSDVNRDELEALASKLR